MYAAWTAGAILARSPKRGPLGAARLELQRGGTARNSAPVAARRRQHRQGARARDHRRRRRRLPRRSGSGADGARATSATSSRRPRSPSAPRGGDVFPVLLATRDGAYVERPLDQALAAPRRRATSAGSARGGCAAIDAGIGTLVVPGGLVAGLRHPARRDGELLAPGRRARPVARAPPGADATADAPLVQGPEDASLSNTAGTLAPGSTRGGRQGIVVLPPLRAPWGAWRWCHRASMPALPAAWLERLLACSAPSGGKRTRERGRVGTPDRGADPRGQAAHRAGRLRRPVLAHGLSEAEALELLELVNAARQSRRFRALSSAGWSPISGSASAADAKRGGLGSRTSRGRHDRRTTARTTGPRDARPSVRRAVAGRAVLGASQPRPRQRVKHGE